MEQIKRANQIITASVMVMLVILAVVRIADTQWVEGYKAGTQAGQSWKEARK